MSHFQCIRCFHETVDLPKKCRCGASIFSPRPGLTASQRLAAGFKALDRTLQEIRQILKETHHPARRMISRRNQVMTEYLAQSVRELQRYGSTDFPEGQWTRESVPTDDGARGDARSAEVCSTRRF